MSSNYFNLKKLIFSSVASSSPQLILSTSALLSTQYLNQQGNGKISYGHSEPFQSRNAVHVSNFKNKFNHVLNIFYNLN